jgi:hypothetical protein
MDSARFDRLVQALGRGRSRRGVLGVLAAFVVAPAAVAAPQTESCLALGKPCSAAETKQALRGQGKGRHRGHHRPSCSTCCSRKSSVGTDGKARCTCKGEGEKCANPAQCCGGQCRSGRCTGCPGETVFCDGSCVNLQTSNQHCGSCEHACTLPETCGGGGDSGQCGCTPTTTCPPGLDCGTISDGCSGTLNCGEGGEDECQSPNICGGGGTPNVCGCLANETVTSRGNRAACCGGSCCGELRDGTPVPDGQCMCDTGCG